MLDPLAQLARRVRGEFAAVEPAGSRGRLLSASSRPAIRDDTLLVSVMLANNEIGVIQPMAEIGGRLPRSAAC